MLEILKQIANTSKSSEKKAILNANKANETLKQVFEYTYNPDKIYGVKNATTVELSKDQVEGFEPIWDYFRTVLDACAKRELTGNAAREALDRCLSRTDAFTQEVLIQVLNKDLKIGIGVSEALKTWPGLVPVFDVVLAKSYKDHSAKVNFDSGEWVVMRKLDGIRIISQNTESGAMFKTREGKDITTMSVMAERFEKINQRFTIDGELCVIDKDGNEDFQSVIKIARKKDYTIPKPTIKAFDFLTNEEFAAGESKLTYTQRMEFLNKLVDAHAIEGILPVEYERVTSKDVFDKWLAKARECKWEGLMLRKDVPYKNGRIAELLKVKDFHDAEYVVENIVKDFLHFNVSAETVALAKKECNIPLCDGWGCKICEAKELVHYSERAISENGGLTSVKCLKAVVINHKGSRVDVGSGFTREERIQFAKNPSLIIGKTITVQYFEETKNENGGISLRFPTFKAIVGDKKRDM